MLVDLQRDFLDPRTIEPSVGSILDRTRLLVECCRERDVPVVHVWTTVTRDPDNRMPHWRRSNRWTCEAGTPGHAPPPSIAPGEGEAIIAKRAFSAFADTDAWREIEKRRIDTVLLAGVHLHACVRQTAIDAYQAGYAVWIASDAVGSDDPIHAAITRRYLEARSIEFLSAEGMIKRLERPVASPGPATSGDRLETAIAAADKCAAAWQRTESAGRGHLVADLKKQAAACQEQLAGLITADVGKPIRNSRAEVSHTLAMIDAVSRRALREPGVEAANSALLRRRPHGVVGVVTPYNNPLYIPLAKIVPAILYGNVVVWKPAPEARQISARLLEIMESAGWPRGLVSLVEGGREAGQRVLGDPRIKAATITGSLAAGASAQEVCARRRVPLQAELGGNNAAIVWDDADLELAAREIAAGAFGMAGQRCTANRRVVLHKNCQAEFFDALFEATAALSWGDPNLDATDVGPLVSAGQCGRVRRAVERATTACGQPLVVHDGAPPTTDDHKAGAWYPPTIIVCDDPDHEIVQEETFGPVLVVQPAHDWLEAVRLCNGVRQGLVAAIFTRSRDRVAAFLADAEAGILKLNRSTADADVDAPFGGWKASGIGPPEHGVFDREFYTRPQTVYGAREPGQLM